MLEKKNVIICAMCFVAALMLGVWATSEDFDAWCESEKMKIIEISNNAYAEK